MAEEIGFVVGLPINTSETEISGNFREVKAYLVEMLAPYKTLEVSEDDVASAKAIQARINKVKERIEEQRKSMKKLWMVPYDEFERKCKELTAECDEAYSNIGAQVKAFEKAKKDSKQVELTAFYESVVAGHEEVREYLPFRSFFDNRWLNATYNIGKAKAEISSKVSACMSDLLQIRELHTDFEPALLDTYKRTRDMNKVLSAHISYINERERKRQEEIRRQQEEAQRQAAAPTPEPEPESEPADDPEPEPQEEPIFATDFRVYCTKEQLIQLGQYMRANGIRYGRVPK